MTTARRRGVVRGCALGLLLIWAACAPLSVARADGDPGSDVLVSQNLFVASDANASVNQQVQLGGLLREAATAGFPIRVAIIASPDDLGAITPLWLKPRTYAGFLGTELSLAYQQRLLVAMPNGFGFNWPRHTDAMAYRLLANVPIRGGRVNLLTAAETAVRRLAAAAGVRITPARRQLAPVVGGGSAPGQPGNDIGAPAVQAGGSDGIHILIGMVVVAVAASAMIIALRRRRRAGAAALPRAPAGRRRPPRRRGHWVVVGVAVVVLAAAGEATVVVLANAPPSAGTSAAATNPYLDPGTAMSRPAPEFTLSNQFGQPVALRSLRGKVVILAFNDSECTTICPLTTTAMVDAKRQLGAAGSQVALLGVDANPKATAIEDVLTYSRLHGMLHEWNFLTGSLSQLKRVWRAYDVASQIDRGLISHTPATFVIDPRGRLRKLYLTQQSYRTVGQLGQLLAHEASSLLPGHPRVSSRLAYAHIPTISPRVRVALPQAGAGSVRLGPNGSPRLFVFFATWDQEVTSLAGHLEALNRYQAASTASRLPALTAIDEGSVEPSPAALPRLLHGLPHPLAYPVAIDHTGRVADGYQVQGVPWLTLTSSAGHILWYHRVSSAGWLSPKALQRQVRAALARAPKTPGSAAAGERPPAGLPPQLAALHQQQSRLLGAEPALAARIRALRGYPIVINAWASWCAPCQAEFGLFADAAAHYGRQVAFLGVDTNDSPGDAQAFLLRHPVGYPSYQSNASQLGALLAGGLQGLPTTIYIDRAGKVVTVHSGQYNSPGTLGGDVQSYALGG